MFWIVCWNVATKESEPANLAIEEFCTTLFWSLYRPVNPYVILSRANTDLALKLAAYIYQPGFEGLDAILTNRKLRRFSQAKAGYCLAQAIEADKLIT